MRDFLLILDASEVIDQNDDILPSRSNQNKLPLAKGEFLLFNTNFWCLLGFFVSVLIIKICDIFILIIIVFFYRC